MSTVLPESSPTRSRWPTIILTLMVGFGLGVVVDRVALRRAGGVFEQKGQFEASAGAGEVHFPHPYSVPPNVELEYSVGPIVVIETTANGFKWRDNSIPPQGRGGTWVARGVKANKVP